MQVSALVQSESPNLEGPTEETQTQPTGTRWITGLNFKRYRGVWTRWKET